MFEILIKNGTVVDGTGKVSFRSDVGIQDEKIVALGDLSGEHGKKEIDAEGKIVCPGFVDVNNHSDTHWRLFSDPDLKSLVYQGITTIVGGNCGSSLAPLRNPKNISPIQKWTDIRKINVDWLSLKDFFSKLKKKPLAVNFATLIGYSTLREGFLGAEERNLTSKEFKILEKSVKKNLKIGALGVSTGLIYSEFNSVSHEELVFLASNIAKKNGIYTTHLKNESNNIIDSLEESIEIARNSGVKLHISHLKIMGEANWNLTEEALLMIDESKKRGEKISLDVYPYTFTSSVLYALLPKWVYTGGKRAMLQKLRSFSLKEKIIEEMKHNEINYGELEVLSSPIKKAICRKKIGEIAKSQGKDVEETVIDMLLASEGQVIVLANVLNEESVRKIIKHPLSMISTNGEGYDLQYAESGMKVHPRSFGAFPRVIKKYVNDEGLLTLEEAIYKMTGWPAECFGIEKRGQIKKGFKADIVIFDKDGIADMATRENPYQYAKGIENVIVNGNIVLEECRYRNIRKGEIIKL